MTKLTISDAAAAEQISEAMKKVYALLNDSIVTVQDRCSPGEAQEYRRAVGRVLGEMYEIVHALYRDHRSLMPPGLFDYDD